jgi:hypothetical protein
MPWHHNLEEHLTAYLDGAGLRSTLWWPLFPTIGRRTAGSPAPLLPQASAYALMRRRAACDLHDTRLYRRRRDDVSLNEVDQIVIWMRLSRRRQPANRGEILRLSYGTKRLNDFRAVFPSQKC